MSGITNERTKAAIDDWMAAKDGRKSRYSELFGTPERAAQTWIDYCGGFLRCADCPCCHDEYGETCELPPGICAWVDEKHGYDALLEWLRGDAE